jgi:hypothetical protein
LAVIPAAPAPRTFHGDPCVGDCSEREAGWDWAEEHNITDPDECGGNSESFLEGCRAYAEDYEEPERAELETREVGLY